MNISVQDITSTIINGRFTNEQLDTIVTAIRFARNQITKQTIRTITVGKNVKFSSSRNGKTLHGKVRKVGRKFVTVDCGIDLVWRVPANMLEAV